MRKNGQMPLFWALFLYAIAATSNAFALDCDSVFADETGQVPAGIAQAAADRLINSGADIRVRVITSAAQYGNLDLYKAEMLKSCRSWQSSDGGMKNNLLVAVLSMDRKAGLYFGDQYRSALLGKTADIRAEYMNPRFRDRDFSGGLAAGLDRAGALIAAAKEVPIPSSAAPSAPVVPIVIEQAPSKPVDLSGLWVVLGLVLVGVAVWFIFSSISRGRRERARARAAQQGAQSRHTACASAINAMPEQFSLLRLQIAQVAKNVSDDGVAALQDRLTALQQKFTTTNTRYTELASLANNPDQPNLSYEEYQRMEIEFTAVYTELESLRTEHGEISRAKDVLAQSAAEAKKALGTLSQKVERAAEALVAAQEQGLDVSAMQTLLNDAVASAGSAEQLMSEKKFTSVFSICADAAKKADQAKKDAEGLPARKKAVVEALQKLRDALPNVDVLAKGCVTTLQELASTYASVSLETVQNAGTQARERVSSVAKAVASIARLIEDQQWQDAERMIAAAELLLEEARSYARSVDAMKQSLAVAKRDAQMEIDDAQADIDTSVAYNKQHDADVNDEVWDRLKRAQESVDSAKALLASPLPDYPRIVELAKQANSLADQTLEQAQNEHQAAERMRRRAASSLRDARASVSRAAEYIEDHHRDVSSSVERQLGEAKRFLDAAERAQDAGIVVRHAETAERNAKKVLEDAQSDVSAAKRARHRTTQTRTSSYGSSSSYRSSSGDGVGDELLAGALGYVVGRATSGSSESHDNDSGGFSLPSFGSGDSGGFGSSSSGDGDSGSW